MKFASPILTLLLVIACAASVAHAQYAAASTVGAAPGQAKDALCELSPYHAPCKRVAFSLDTRFGIADAPFYTSNLPRVRGHGFIGVLGASVRLPRAFTIGASLPLISMNVQQPAGSYVNELSIGNASLSARHTLIHESKVSESFASCAELTVGLPFAARASSRLPLASQALVLSHALEAARRPELYTQGVVPIMPSIGHQLRFQRLYAQAELRLPLLLRFSDAGLPEAADPSPVGIAGVLHGATRIRLTRRLEISLAADTVVNLVDVARLRHERSRTQFSLSPGLCANLGDHMGLSVSVLIPIAGSLGGSTYATSMMLAAGF